jgi:exodeoxyribonuclease V alpha subunit
VPREPEQDLDVTVERVCYPPETTKDADWFILATSMGTCKGNMSWRPRENERLTLTGRYAEYQGKREFKFTQAALNLPTDSRGMLHYVCEMTSGIGLAMEADIWAMMGDRWPDIEEGALPRFKGKVFDNFMQAIERAEGDRAKGNIISQLLAAGCTMNMANAAYEKWEKSTIGVVSHDPYRLAELSNYGFQDVDGAIRQHFGIADDDPKRIRAAVVYVLRQMTGSGSTLVQWEKLNSQCLAKLGGYQELILQAVNDMFEEGTLKGFGRSKSVALAADYFNENTIWNFIQSAREAVAECN